MDDLYETMVTGEQLLQKSMDTMRRYHEARASLASVEEVGRLRLEAESLMQAVIQYQQQALGGLGSTLH
ncbi:hypothetical protein QEP73_15475 [Pseudomonas defluvii]|nr:hypothetical protein QEP73_15475 [Pseudomonas defluvii]